MNFKHMFVLVSMVAGSAAGARLGFNGGIHAADRFGYMSPRTRAVLVKMIAMKRCKALGRFC